MPAFAYKKTRQQHSSIVVSIGNVEDYCSLLAKHSKFGTIRFCSA